MLISGSPVVPAAMNIIDSSAHVKLDPARSIAMIAMIHFPPSPIARVITSFMISLVPP